MGRTAQENQRLYQVARNAIWRYRLDEYETEVLKSIAAALDTASTEIYTSLDAWFVSQFREERAEALLAEFDRLTLGTRAQLTDDIQEAAAVAGEYATATHNDILSFGGRVATFNNVSLTADQFRSFFATEPFGGRLLSEWVDAAFDSTVREGMQRSIQSGVLQGEGYRKLTNRLRNDFGLAKREAVTLARTYVQSANVAAQEAVFAANADIVQGVEWCAVLEQGHHETGRGTCLRCSGLDGNEYRGEEPRPPMPLHPNCRCVWVPLLASFRELGLDIDELDEAARPYTIRENRNIDAGNNRTILEHGLEGGSYTSWFESRGKDFQLNVVGPGRMELLESGKARFRDFVDSTTGRQIPIHEVLGKRARPGSLRVTTSMQGENLLREVTLTNRDRAALTAYTGQDFVELNRGLRTKAELSGERKALGRDLSRAINKLPMYDGVVHRGIRLQSPEALEQFEAAMQRRKVEVHPAFTSASTRREMAEHYAGDGPRVLYEIRSKRGRYLGEYSATATTPKSIDEREVLFDRRSRFVIQSVQREGQVLYVRLSEK